MIEITELYSNKWISLRSVEDEKKRIPPYIYKHVTPSDGHTVAILPWRMNIGKEILEFLIINEVRPCWSIQDDDLEKKHYQSITGAIDIGERPVIAAMRELVEETGFKVEKNKMVSLGNSFVSKASDTIYHLFCVNLNEISPGKKETTEMAEQSAETFWFEENQLHNIADPLVAQMYLKFKNNFK
jgi:8-oxo-dGTP pyrophosphatase MutT (NUDIX family)